MGNVIAGNIHILCAVHELARELRPELNGFIPKPPMGSIRTREYILHLFFVFLFIVGLVKNMVFLAAQVDAAKTVVAIRHVSRKPHVGTPLTIY